MCSSALDFQLKVNPWLFLVLRLVCQLCVTMMSWVGCLPTVKYYQLKKVKRMGITESLRRIWLCTANKIKSSESFSKQPTQIIMELNSSLRHIIVTLVSSYLGLGLLRIDWVMTQAKNPSKFFKCSIKKIKSWQFHDNFKCLFIGNSQNWLRNVECKNWITSILCIVHYGNTGCGVFKGGMQN